MRKKSLIILFLMVMLFSTVGTVAVNAGSPYDGDNQMDGGMCQTFNCGTQNCLVFMISFCIGDGLSWHNGF
ncbi:MAG: hypothetical protein P1R58_13115 [bacterium]|nr:hypothetical protein [bacterium]